MSRISTSEKLQKIFNSAIQQMDEIYSAVRDERLQCLQDRRFYSIAGAQWEGPLGDQFENKPRFEVNKVHLSVIRIINEYRNNRVTVDFIPKDGAKNEKLADVCDALYRADEQDSCADEAYDNAFEEAVGGGFGAYRLRAEYEDEEDPENEHQRIRIEPIYDADSSVFFDINAKRQDKSDARHCFVITAMSYDAFNDEYPDETPTTWDKVIQQTEFDWFTPDMLYVAEYFVKEQKGTTIHTYTNLLGDTKKLSDEELDVEGVEEELIDSGFKETKSKKIKQTKIHKYVLSGSEVIEDCGIIAGKNIPIVPVYGKRWYVDNTERCMGHVRLAKDTQRLKNMQLSKLGEISALSSIEKPILMPEQVAGHTMMWSEDNIKNFPYLLINPIIDPVTGQIIPGGPVAYTKSPSIPPAMAALLQLTDQDMQDLLGNQQAGEEIQPNTSGLAVELVQNKLDMQAFIYISNLAKGVRRGGEIWLSMAKDIFVEEGRVVKGISPQGSSEAITLMSPNLNKDTKEIVYDNDLSTASMDVVAEVGPSSASRRAATVRALTGMMAINQDPESAQVLSSMAMMNMEGEGISDVRDYYRKRLIKMGVVKPTDDEAAKLEEELQNTPPDPQAEYLRSASEAAQADAMKSKSETILTLAKSKLTEAQTVETLTGIKRDDRAQLVDTVNSLGKALQPANKGV